MSQAPEGSVHPHLPCCSTPPAPTGTSRRTHQGIVLPAAELGGGTVAQSWGPCGKKADLLNSLHWGRWAIRAGLGVGKEVAPQGLLG